MMGHFDLTGRRALVTGSSRGIGKALALGLAAYGADVLVHCTGRPDAAAAVADEIQSMGRKSGWVQKDLGDPDCAEVLAQRAEALLGGVDILICNASIQDRKHWSAYTAEDFDRHMHINALSTMLLVQRVLPAMQAQGWGRVLTIGSVQEVAPHPDMLIYAATKAAQSMFMKSLATQLSGQGITFNNLAPGVILTDRNTKALADETYAQRVLDLIPARYFGEPRDCVGPALLLCSDAGRYITGESIVVDGGKQLPSI